MHGAVDALPGGPHQRSDGLLGKRKLDAKPFCHMTAVNHRQVGQDELDVLDDGQGQRSKEARAKSVKPQGHRFQHPLVDGRALRSSCS
jgi:hypothetical protein